MRQQTDAVAFLLNTCRTIAVVGLSAQEDRPSYEVAQYMQAHGYRIVPVNPTYAGTHILGEHCFSTMTQAAQALSGTGAAIELVNCFRRAEHIPALVEEAIALGAKGVWTQLGIVNQVAAERAEAAGLVVVMDKCIKIEHMRFN